MILGILGSRVKGVQKHSNNINKRDVLKLML